MQQQQQQQQRSRVVFVGNLPFDYTEEQLVEVFGSVGPVVSFRLVFDHATGKPKGFGFCEYRDPETAASALRNLQGVEVGGRGLRLDFADTEDAPPSRRGDRPPGGGGGGGTGPPPSKPLPPGVQLPPGASAVDSITQTLATIPPSQLLDIMGQMKALVTTSPHEARVLLNANPQLSYALFQAMLMMNIVDAGVLQKMLPPPPPPPVAQPPSSYGVPPSSYTGRAPPLSYPPQPSSQYGEYSQPHPPAKPPASYGGPPPPPQVPPQQVAPDQAALIAQVLSMTQQQIDQLPPDSRNTIMQIRAQAAALPARR